MDHGRLLSVIVPTYNRRRFIAGAIDSILRQDYRPLEVVVVDDGSTDDTSEVLAPYFDRIRYIRQENRGVSAARNRGVAESSGAYVAFLDSDDLWMPRRLSAQLDHARKGIACFGGVEWFCDGRESETVPAETLGVRWPRVTDSGFVRDPVLDVAEGLYLHLGTLLCERSDFEAVGPFDERLCMGEDEDWFARAALRLRFHYAREPLLRRRFHANQTETDSEESLRSLIEVFINMAARNTMHARAHAIARRRLAAKWSHLANWLREERRQTEAREAALTAYRLNPYRPGPLVKALMMR